MARRLQSESGQALIMFVGLFTIIALAAAITVDFGLWLSERRGSQTDADLVALAGAYELLVDTATLADVDVATQDSALANALDPADDLHNLEVKSLEFPDGFENDPGYCHDAPDTGGRLNAVVLDVDHETSALFADVFRGLGGLAAEGSPDIGAHACARAGSLRSAQGLRPWVIPMVGNPCFDDEFIPQFGEDCIFRLDEPSQVGSIRLGPTEDDDCQAGSGGDVYKDNIINGAGAVCEIGDLIDTEPGLVVGKTMQALETLLAGEGQCDSRNGDGDGIDQFYESFEAATDEIGPDAVFTPRDCTTPRALHIVIVEELDPPGMQELEIKGFAAFFLLRCEELDNDGHWIGSSEKCDLWPGSGGSSFQILGRFMRTVELEGDIGDFDEFGTNAIRLTE